MFTGGIERDQWHEMGQSVKQEITRFYLVSILIPVVFNFLKIVCFLRSLGSRIIGGIGHCTNY